VVQVHSVAHSGDLVDAKEVEVVGAEDVKGIGIEAPLVVQVLALWPLQVEF
jgi:hypothetical protein